MTNINLTIDLATVTNLVISNITRPVSLEQKKDDEFFSDLAVLAMLGLLATLLALVFWANWLKWRRKTK